MKAITGRTAIALDTSDPEHKEDCLNKINAASEHLLGVINDILDMSKIGADKLELSPTAFRFAKCIDDMVNIIRFRVEEKQQRFEQQMDPNIPDILVGDPQRLAQVIGNLLTNAVKFTPEAGEIRLAVTLEKEKDGVCTIRFDVADTGIGVTEEQQARLFTSFEQADSSTARKYGGTGLGLAISKFIVEQMHGEIWVESEPGKGATFSFRVQLLRAAREDLPGEGGPLSSTTNHDDLAEEVNDFSGRQILLAEDVEINREIIMTMLASTNIGIDCAENGIEALALYRNNPGRYDMIFMDIQMPEMDGYEATQNIRKFETEHYAADAADAVDARPKVPIIALTANVFREDIEKCLAVGMDDHIGKPVDFKEVLLKLRTYLKER
jgi:CheY-like chemotaxis protein